MKITKLEKYTPEAANQIRQLLIQLSRTHKDPGEISKQYIHELIASPYHDILIAQTDDDKIVGVALLSIIANFKKKKAYLEDFVTDDNIRGQGIGSKMWEEMLIWAKNHDCTELDFTSGKGREAAWDFYLHKGATIYDTNFFRRQV